jgi:Permeases of the drug/metabolite transporter (DMT) superfamily
MRRLLPYLLLVLPPLCWAGNFVVGRAVHGAIPPAALTFWRWMVAAAILLPVTGITLWKQRALLRPRLGWLGLLAFSGVLLFQYAVYVGLRTTPAITGTLIIAVIPVVIPLFAFGLDGTRVDRRQALGIALSLTGVCVIILKGDPATLKHFHESSGEIWLLAAVVAWALYSVLVRRRPPELAPPALLLAIVCLGLVMTLPLYGWELATTGGFELTWQAVLAIGYVGAFASVIAFLCWNEGVSRLGPARAGLFIHLMPIFTAILAVLFLGERLHLYHAVGVALVLAGIALSSSGRPGVKAG